MWEVPLPRLFSAVSISFVLSTAVPSASASPSFSWVDPDSPIAVQTTTAHKLDDGRSYRLVFSDEFNREGRTFPDGNDPRWTALDKNDLTNNPLHYYSDSNAYTHNGQLVLRSDLNTTTFAVYDGTTTIGQEPRYHNQTKQVRSAMVQSWNKFCFTGGIAEFSATLPGKPYTGGMWPALWMMGNLARATYVNSSEHMWPFSTNRLCDDRVQAQEINACQAPRGRGAPEIDFMEVMYVSQINASILSSSLQVAPGLAHHRPILGELPNKTWYQPVIGNSSSLNEYFYGVKKVSRHPKYEFQTDTLSVNHYVDETYWTHNHKFRVEWEPPSSDGSGGYIYWFIDGQLIQGIHGEELQRVSQTEIPSEPMYLIMNVAVSKDWSFPDAWFLNCPYKCWTCGDPRCDCALPKGYCDTFPTEFLIDYVRVYQTPNDPRHDVGCSPRSHPTADFIAAHKERYMVEGQRQPLLPIVRGGASCTHDIDCGEGTCHQSHHSNHGTATDQFPSSSPACECHDGWTGPNCLAHIGRDPVVSRGRIGSMVYWLLTCLVLLGFVVFHVAKACHWFGHRALYESLNDMGPDQKAQPRKSSCCKGVLCLCLIATLCVHSGNASIAPLGVAHGNKKRRRAHGSVRTFGSYHQRQWNTHNLLYPASQQSVFALYRKPFFLPSAHASSDGAISSTVASGDFSADGDISNEHIEVGLLGKTIAGVVEIAFATLLEYISGFVGGYTLGTFVGLPAFLTKPITDQPAATRHFWAQLTHRAGRMHTRSSKWARNWGGISAAFGGFQVATKVLRGGKDDEWSTIFSSMAAGAFFARKEGPQAMLRGAVLYGGFMYLVSGGLRPKKEPFEYQEEKIDF